MVFFHGNDKPDTELKKTLDSTHQRYASKAETIFNSQTTCVFRVDWAAQDFWNYCWLMWVFVAATVMLNHSRFAWPPMSNLTILVALIENGARGRADGRARVFARPERLVCFVRLC